jgi:hypothetical protein
MIKLASDIEWDLSLTATVSKVDDLGRRINALGIFTRRLDIYPFDTVAGEMLAKAFSICRAAITLVENQYPDEAFGLLRSLYECSIYLRYITGDCEKRNERARKFIEFGSTSKAFWLAILEKSSDLTEEERQDVNRYKNENQIPNDAKIMTLPWSGVRRLIELVSKAPHPVDAKDSTETLRDKQRAFAYTDTSCYVHCTQSGLNTFSHAWKEQILTRHPYTPSTDTAEKSCAVIQIHLLDIVKYCLYRMNLDFQ